MNDEPLRLIAALGLAAGAILGLVGSFTAAPLRGLLWAIDGTALVTASALLAVLHFRQGHDLAAAGFVVFAIGQGLILSGATLDPGEIVVISSFAAGTALWAAGVALVSGPRVMPPLVRILGFVAAALLAAHAAIVFSGHPLTSLSTPLPLVAYPFLVATLLCWAWITWKGPR